MDNVAVIDFRANRNDIKTEMEAATKIRYKAITTVERTNSELKANFLPYALYFRGKKSHIRNKAGCPSFHYKEDGCGT